MHGQRKLTAEGYRTRDGHLIEWFGRTLTTEGVVAVVSRPDPWFDRGRSGAALLAAPGTYPVSSVSFRLPDLRSRQAWWHTSARAYPPIPPAADRVPAVVWNPFVATAPAGRSPFDGRRVVLDLLDDWSTHFAFAPIRAQVEDAYAQAFRAATHVTANGEGTMELASRFGRDDVVFLPNGCDPLRFSTDSVASGATTVGYVGKIGRRLDLEGIVATARALPSVEFVFAGPILDSAYRAPLAATPNITLVGDVHYRDVPELLRSFDAGWVPHHVGVGEVGGDVIKTYEYRAAGLVTLTTPIAGAGARGLDGVTVADMNDHAAVLRSWIQPDRRIARRPGVIPAESTWEHKAQTMLDLLSA
ncbi:glycosyltransferase [Curtobacterium sp. ISL-83]|uniref:glycosyltransferase n=1 Tax=Curtobacterium sp. ISL-83 TaxID=2819145 RepID=UPI001BE82EA0|nr:glycosyltransferase [Curtobacterium sp. ISL-83]MBT2502635.1 glycosyltransferase [Curtobacterium sp. ISL-83]